jgi:2-keto-4-pentenoate hydratase/2-oxohepta-3-ene-1,7-dioic acid hydratase in catechol pathway
MQDSNTSNLIFPLDELVAYISLATTIEAGDVLATGTPGGVGDSRRPPRYLRAGDVVEIDVQGVPKVRNPVELERP